MFVGIRLSAITPERIIAALMIIVAAVVGLNWLYGHAHPLEFAGMLVAEVLLLQVYIWIHSQQPIRKVILISFVVLAFVLVLIFIARFPY